MSTPLARESITNLGKLLQDVMPAFVRDAGGRDLDPDDRGPGSFRQKVVDDLKLRRPGTYILTGGVGSGKTSFLRRFAGVTRHAFIRDYCIWLHVDYLPLGPAQNWSSQDIETYTFTKVRDALTIKYPAFVPKTGEEIREIFEPEIDEARLTLLFGVEPESSQFRDEVNKLVMQLANDPERYIHGVLRSAQKAGRCIAFVLDNSDQQGEDFQRSVFLLSQKLSDRYRAISIVSLREERFFSAYRDGVFDAYGTRKFHIGSPELIHVIHRRLEYGLERYQRAAQADNVPKREQAETEKVVRALIESSTDKNGNIIRFLACVSAGDMRLALNMYHDFMSSGNTLVSY